jgi:hypothetical protein
MKKKEKQATMAENRNREKVRKKIWPNRSIYLGRRDDESTGVGCWRERRTAVNSRENQETAVIVIIEREKGRRNDGITDRTRCDVQNPRESDLVGPLGSHRICASRKSRVG